MKKQGTFGLARIHAEPGEKRDFLPKFVKRLAEKGVQVALENGYGSGMGFLETDYLQAEPTVRFAPAEQIYQQDYPKTAGCQEILRSGW